MKQIVGTIIQGAGRGRSIGFPTANIGSVQSPSAIPPAGIYAAWVNIDGKRCMGALHVGPRPTFNDTSATIEVHIIQFPDENIYGKTISVLPMKKLRNIKKFDTIEELQKAIHKDIHYTKDLLTTSYSLPPTT